MASIVFELQWSHLIFTLLVSFEPVSQIERLTPLDSHSENESKVCFWFISDFECILDRHMQPLAFSEPSTLQMSDKVLWATNSLVNVGGELPPGAQRCTSQTQHLER